MKTFYYTNMTRDRYNARQVEVRIEQHTGLILDNPFYANDGTPTKEIAALDSGATPDVSWPEITEPDEKKVRESDGIIAYLSLDKFTFGSPVEIYMCAMMGKPTYVISPLEGIRKHPFVQKYSKKIFSTEYEFIKWYNFEQKGPKWLNWLKQK